MANHRRKNNYVEELRINGETTDMRQKAMSFFQQLYKEDGGRRPRLDELLFKQLSAENKEVLEVPFNRRGGPQMLGGM